MRCRTRLHRHWGMAYRCRELELRCGLCVAANSWTPDLPHEGAGGGGREGGGGVDLCPSQHGWRGSWQWLRHCEPAQQMWHVSDVRNTEIERVRMGEGEDPGGRGDVAVLQPVPVGGWFCMRSHAVTYRLCMLLPLSPGCAL